MEKKEEVVDASKFGDLLAFVGPLDPHLPSFVFNCFFFVIPKKVFSLSQPLKNRRVKYLLKEDYFHGYLSSQEAEVCESPRKNIFFPFLFSEKSNRSDFITTKAIRHFSCSFLFQTLARFVIC